MGIVIAAADAAAKKSSNSTELLLLIVLVFAGFYFLMIRPQRRRQQQAQQKKQSAATPGARVRTVGGMYATIIADEGDDVVLEVAPGVEVRYIKRSIAEVIDPGEPEADETVDDDEPGYHGDASAEDDHEVTDSTGSAEDGLASSHDGLASSDKDNVF
ncbi:MAG: preprotein translocase subunit YajC [Streptosporangiaceae bacterium]